jgi:ribonuclease Z
MPAIFSPRLVNDPFGDPGLYVDFRFRRRALLFDMGDLGPQPAKQLVRVSDVFVSHTHMDHFIGFDRLLRVCLGRDARLRLFGPPGFPDQVEHKLGAYTWNLVPIVLPARATSRRGRPAAWRAPRAPGLPCRSIFRRATRAASRRCGTNSRPRARGWQ